MTITVSVIIPAFNEEALIVEALQSVRLAIQSLPTSITAEVIVVDNASTDDTCAVVESLGFAQLLHCPKKGAARARNFGAEVARGEILLFLDADTTIPAEAIGRIVEECHQKGIGAGITRLAAMERGIRSCFWWYFWNAVRLLPLPRAKAMPAFMFCTKKIFDEFGPFDEQVAIGEEWPILAGLYRSRPREFSYLRAITAMTSSRRMECVPFGYTRLFLKYVWAILDRRGRIHYSDTIRTPLPTTRLLDEPIWNRNSLAQDIQQ